MNRPFLRLTVPTIFVVSCCAFVAFTLTSAASAALLIYEPFDYTAGSAIIPGLTTTNSGNGLVDTYGPNAPTTWVQTGAKATGTTPHQVSSPGLTAPAGFAASVGNAAALEGGASGRSDNAEMARMTLPGGPYLTSSVVYYSLLLNVSDLTGLTVLHSNLNAANDMIISLNNASGTQAGRPSLFADMLTIRAGSAANTYNLGIRSSTTANNTTFFDSTDYAPNTTLLVVTRFTEGATAGTGGLSELWINPSSVSFGAVSAPAADGSSAGTYSSAGANDHTNSLLIGAGIAPGSNPNVVTVDEIRVGTTWADVTPTAVPEASAFLTIGLGGIFAVAAVWMSKRIGVNVLKA